MRADSEGTYKQELVDVETFFRDERYLGGVGLYPQWLSDLQEVFRGPFDEVIFTGGLGSGKTFAASAALCRMLYELSRLRDPQASLGLGSGSVVSLGCLSVSPAFASDVILGGVARMLRSSPYFCETFPHEERPGELRFPSDICVTAGALSSGTSLGRNLLGVLVEAPVTSKFTAKDLRKVYLGLRRRVRSRFGAAGRGKVFLTSSKRDGGAFLTQRLREVVDDPAVLVRDYALWDSQLERFGSARFFVRRGSGEEPPKIVKEDEVLSLRVDDVRAGWVDVPAELRGEFERDLEGSLRDLAGVVW